MDLSFTPEEQAFAREVRELAGRARRSAAALRDIADEVDFGRRWQAELAAGDRWVGIHWPREYGGRGASPVQVAIFNMEYARSRALQPINRVGINLAGPTLLAHGTEEQKAAVAAVDPHAPRRSGASCSASPTPAPTSPSLRTRARPVDGGWVLNGPEGVDLLRAVRALGHLPRPHRRRSAQAQGHLVPRRRHGGARHRDPAAGADHRRRRVQRGVLRRRVRARRPSRRRAEQRLGGRQHHARARARHDVPVQGAGRARGVPRRAVAARGRAAGRSTTSRSPTRSRSRSSSCACCGCTTGARCRASPKGIEPGPGVEHHQAGVDRHDPSTVGARARRRRAAPRRCGGAPTTTRAAATGSGSGCGRRPASIAGGTSEVQKNIIGERILGLPRG